VYGLDKHADKKELNRFSAHSLRVGACCILQAMGFEDHEIKKLLRWKSDAWMVYTRNLVIVTKRHNRAVYEASLMPIF
jgi:hypothetical protein